jgi:hypothetical protein
MSTIADLLDPAARQRLAALGSPPPNEDLAASARAAAAGSDGSGRVAWLCVTVALTSSESLDDARVELGRMLEDGKLKATALACLRTLTDPGGGTAAP